MTLSHWKSGKFAVLFLLLTNLELFARAESALGEKDLDRIGRRVWQNECAGSVDGLTSWNAGEKFASLGIGHFIWYPRGMRGPFDESFPKLLGFLRQRGVSSPAWLESEASCPWPNRSAFLADFHGARMQELRSFLTRTIQQQAAFLAERSRESLPKMLGSANPTDRENISQQFARLSSSSAGTFALIDYVNFKGEGVLSTERYQNQGWGLLQVLAGMHGSGPGGAREFADSAKTVLARRVRNAPPERHEERWLSGWKNRVESYAN